MGIWCEPFGVLTDGRKIERWTMERGGARVSVITYGAAIQELTVPDQGKRMIDVVTGFDTAGEYEKSRLHFGATIGRCCNRIRGGRFFIGGTGYQLSLNSPPHHIHGGYCGMDRKVWSAETEGEDLVMTCRCADQEEGYPGNLDVNVRFVFQDHSLCIQYTAMSDKDTLCSLTNHTYFNLNGYGDGTAVLHDIRIPAEFYVPMDKEGIPLGYIRQVRDTVYDMRTCGVIGVINHIPDPPSACYLPDGRGMRSHAVLCGDKSKIVLRVRSTMPALQYYTGYLIPEGTRGKQGAVYGPCQGICLETQFVPDAVNHRAFACPILHRGERYRQETQYIFRSMGESNESG